MAPTTNGTVTVEFEQHQREVVNTFARAALAMRDAAKVAEEFANWFARVNNIKDIPSASFGFGSAISSSSDTTVAGKKRKADKDSSPPLDEGGKKKRAPKKPRDKDAPKRPPSAYILFQNEVRKEIKNEHPTMSNMELLKEVSKLWSTVSGKEKGLYLERHEALKSKYDEEKAAYDAKLGPTPDEKEEKPKKPAKKESKATTTKEGSKVSAQAKPIASEDSDLESPKDEEEDEQEQDEIEPESTDEVEEEEKDEVENSEVESESESESEPERPKKKAKVDGVHSNSRKSPPPAKEKEKDKKFKKDKNQEEEKKKKKY